MIRMTTLGTKVARADFKFDDREEDWSRRRSCERTGTRMGPKKKSELCGRDEVIKWCTLAGMNDNDGAGPFAKHGGHKAQP